MDLRYTSELPTYPRKIKLTFEQDEHEALRDFFKSLTLSIFRRAVRLDSIHHEPERLWEYSMCYRGVNSLELSTDEAALNSLVDFINRYGRTSTRPAVIDGIPAEVTKRAMDLSYLVQTEMIIGNMSPEELAVPDVVPEGLA